MEYKACKALIIYSNEDNTFVGKVLNLENILVFDGDKVEETKHSLFTVVNFQFSIFNFQFSIK
jgi:predicted HicB family RNase H-like nuclease